MRVPALAEDLGERVADRRDVVGSGSEHRQAPRNDRRLGVGLEVPHLAPDLPWGHVRPRLGLADDAPDVRDEGVELCRLRRKRRALPGSPLAAAGGAVDHRPHDGTLLSGRRFRRAPDQAGGQERGRLGQEAGVVDAVLVFAVRLHLHEHAHFCVKVLPGVLAVAPERRLENLHGMAERRPVVAAGTAGMRRGLCRPFARSQDTTARRS